MSKTNVNISFNLVVQSYNILDLPEILDEFILFYIKHNRLNRPWSVINIICVDYPDMLSIPRLPSNIKREAFARIQSWETRQNKFILDKIAPGGLDIIRKQLLSTDSGNPKRILDYSRFVDQNKKATLGKNLPELKRMLEEAVNDGTG